MCHPACEEKNVRRRLLTVVVFVLSFTVLASGVPPVPSDGEVKVALQSVLVAAAATMAGRNFTPPLQFAESNYVADANFSSFRLEMDGADIGLLREQVLAREAPQPRQMGLFEALLKNVLQVVPDHGRLIAYLVPQALRPGEVFFTGFVEAARLASPVPFRYEGAGSIQVSGSRFAAPFSLAFSFVVPLEGPGAMAIIPVSLRVGEADYLHVATALFPAPLLPDGQQYTLP